MGINLSQLDNPNTYIAFITYDYNSVHFYSYDEKIKDIKVKYIKKLITRYIEKKDLKERLILNHIIILNNCFGPEVLCKILYLKLKNQMRYIKPFLILLNILPNYIYNINDESVIDTNLIDMDDHIVSVLRKLS